MLSHVFSSSTTWLPYNPTRTYFSCKRAKLDGLLSSWGNSRKRCLIRAVLSEKNDSSLNPSFIGFKKSYLQLCRQRNLSPLASADESVTVNGSPQASTSSDVEKMRIRLDDSRKQDCNDGLVQSLHDAARNFELAIKEHSASSKMRWFSTAWLGMDRNAWVKSLSYQVITNDWTFTFTTNLGFTFLSSFPCHVLKVVNNISYSFHLST